MEDDTAELEVFSFIWTIENLKFFMLDYSLKPMRRCIFLEKAPYRFTLELNRKPNFLFFDVVIRYGDDQNLLGDLSFWYEIEIKANFPQGLQYVVTNELEQGTVTGNTRCRIQLQYNLKQYDQAPFPNEHEISFTIYVLLPQPQRPHNVDLDTNLELLSSDLSSLYERGRESEGGISCKSSNGSLLLIHSAILAGRCPYFKENPKEFLRTMEKFPSVVLDKLFRYIYSGYFEFKKSDYKHLMKFRDAILDLKLPVLSNIFEPRKYFLKTLIPTTNKGYRLLFENIYSSAQSEVQTIKCSDLKFHCRLCTETPTVAGGKSFSLELELFYEGGSQKAPDSIFFEVHNISFCSPPVCMYHDQSYMPSLRRIIRLKFVDISPDDLGNLNLATPGGDVILNITLKIRLQSSSAEVISLKKVSVEPNYIDFGRNLRILSLNLSDVLHDKQHCDFKIADNPEIQQSPYRLHKAILAARWPSFANSTNDVIWRFTSRASSDSFQKVLKFVYSGEIDLHHISKELPYMCFLALKYDYPALRELCYSTFKRKINLVSVRNVLDASETMRSEYLMSETMRFMKVNFAELAQSVIWRTFEADSLLLIKIAVRFARGETLLPSTN